MESRNFTLPSGKNLKEGKERGQEKTNINQQGCIHNPGQTLQKEGIKRNRKTKGKNYNM